MAERLNALVLKTSKTSRVSRVRIPVPPLNFKIHHLKNNPQLMYNLKRGDHINMNEFYRNIYDALIMLNGLEKDLNIRHFSPNELKVFYTIVTQSTFNEGDSNISEIVNHSGMSRSTVYKT